ncbi:hypothetical protein [Pontivivens nitratireducens]|uniref:hypothetical protein n=1 Tax=Pontivivens nitratireducens TaxID=2758038 RepID=UPI001639A6ED|nr:hypothetical protein [Pontibrevibacter nitratireducens]
MFEPVEVKKLHHDQLWNIISSVADELSIKIPQGFLMRIGIISDSFPHFVHLIGESIFYQIYDDEDSIQECTEDHFKSALSVSLAKAEPSLRSIYDLATQKSSATKDYEEALWALADRTATRRQIKDIYENSYLRVNSHRGVTEKLSREKLNGRMLALRKDSHSNIIVGTGSGWFEFRENVVRGYVRLRAEAEGVPLVPELTK